MRIIDYDTHFHITWEYNHWHAHNLKAVKAIGYKLGDGLFIQESKYIVKKKGAKYWFVPGSYRFQVIQLIASNHAKIIKHSEVTAELIGEVPPLPQLTVEVPWKPGVIPRPYQNEGIAQGMKMQRCLIGDEQGLGKTMQAIGIMVALQVKPIIVVCPASTKINWKREFEKFSYFRPMVLDGKMSPALKKNWHQYVTTGLVDVVIINYESIKTFLVESYPQEKSKNGKKKPWHSKDVILNPIMSLFKGGILDESQRCKDRLRDQTKFVLRLFHGLTYRLLLSGTPILKRPIDLFPQLAIMGVTNRFGTEEQYKERYCDGGKGANNLRELNYLLNLHCFFRREKKDVAKDLPEKQRQTLICDITNRDEYDKIAGDFKRWLESQGLTFEEVAQKMEGEGFLKMQHLKAVAARGKMAAVKEFVDEVIDAGEKMILFCNLHEIVDACLELWPHAVTLTGRDDMNKRQRAMDAFQMCKACGVNLENHIGKDHDHVPSDTQLIICNHKAAGVGVNLTAASRVGFIEYPWNSSGCFQCEDRAHRIGVRNAVMCSYWLAENTVDEKMWEFIMEGMEIANTITGATDNMENMEKVDKRVTLFS